MKMHVILLLTVAVVSLALFAQSASAVLSIDYNPAVQSNENTGSTATALFNFSDQSGDVFIDVQLFNTTPDAIGSTLMAITMDLPEGIEGGDMSLDSLSSKFDVVQTNVTLPGSSTFDFGVGLHDKGKASKVFHGGPTHDGLDHGDSAAFRLVLDSALTAAQVEDLFADGYESGSLETAVRFQDVGPNGELSDVVYGDPRDPVEPNPEPKPIPEPMTTTLGLLSLAGIAVATRRRR